MKAPEKIYVAETTFPDHIDWDGSPINTNRIEENDIEYIRTDAFVDKAIEFIELNVCDYIDVTHKGGIEHLELQERFIRKFKEAMKL